MSKYEKEVAVRREEEASYHRREYELSPQPPTTTTTTTTSYYPQRAASKKTNKQVSAPSSADEDAESTDDDDKYEQWTTTKTKVNHKTRQVETRVSRQLLVEDGRVIADSGPQVTTRIKEDNKLTEREKEKAPKSRASFEALDAAQEVGDGKSRGRVLGEKKQVQRKSREVREENMQYHDERFKELSGHDVHRKAIQAPHELITITNDDNATGAASKPRGKMVHYSNKGKKYEDTDEILEVAKLAIDGSITKEVKRTKHHQEIEDDEKPDETGEADQLRNTPTVTRSSRRHFDYVNDFDDTDTPSEASDDEVEHHATGGGGGGGGGGDSRSLRSHQSHRSAAKNAPSQAFPKYTRDPLLNSIRDEDYRPATGAQPGRRLNLERAPESAYSSRSTLERPAVEIPAEYRANKDKLIRSKSTASAAPGRHHKPAARGHQQQHQSVQAQLTSDEDELESSVGSHARLTRNLARQSTKDSKRKYYYDAPATGARGQRRPSLSSASSVSSASDPKEQLRKSGAKSRDSGFRSPGRRHLATDGGDIYAVSGKSRSRVACSPTPSAGQRSVKTTTTTTTLGANLADRPTSLGSAAAAKRHDKTRTATTTTIKVPYRQLAQRQADKQTATSDDANDATDDDDDAVSVLTIEHDADSARRLRANIELLRRRLDNISLVSADHTTGEVLACYHLVGQHQQQPPKELLGCDLMSQLGGCGDKPTSDLGSSALSSCETSSSSTTSKYYQKIQQQRQDCDCTSDDGSLKSTKTYDIRAIRLPEVNLNQPRQAISETTTTQAGKTDADELGDARAWIFDPTDGSSTRIEAPPKAAGRQPEGAELAAKTEQLGESRGGKSYYLELVDKNQPHRPKEPARFSRWRSMQQLGLAAKTASPAAKAAPVSGPLKAAVSSRQLSRLASKPSASASANASQRRAMAASSSNLLLASNRCNNLLASRPCLSASTSSIGCPSKSSKYSIYGGLKKPDAAAKPVPRLSYSRAIGPRLHRPKEPQLKQPSRYLKMK